LRILEILVRLPINDTLRPYASRILHLNLSVVFKDNEENALVSMRIIFELLRAFNQNLEPGKSNLVLAG
jgi:transformation/transcription domain-associated protein